MEKVNLDDTEENEDWIKSGTRKRLVKEQADKIVASNSNSIWTEFTSAARSCNDCHNDGLLHHDAKPLFQEYPPKNTDLLFIWEAPNYADSFDPDKGYITVKMMADPTSQFFCDLFRNELGLDLDRDLFITNSVLCLPAKKKGKYPASIKQQHHCAARLKQLIDHYRPLIVCTLGKAALTSTALIEEHGLGSMAEAVGRELRWYGRILFPLYHTGLQARTPRNGRPEKFQREDWQRLKECLANQRKGVTPNISTEDIDRLVESFDTDREFRISKLFSDCGMEPLSGRLRRAAYNQQSKGEAMESRYAIWANTVRDTIIQAERDMSKGNLDEARRLIRRAANSLSAFSELQARFDTTGISRL